MALIFSLNPFTGELDVSGDTAQLDDLYVNISGDTMTGDLYLPTLHATDSGISEFFGGIETTYLEALDAGISEFFGGVETTYLEALDPGYSVFNGGVIIKSGKKLIFDGA